MINEVLNSDRDINLKVVDIQKKALKHFNDNIQLVPTDDQAVLENVDSVIDKLVGTLQDKENQIDTIPLNQVRSIELVDYKTLLSQLLEVAKVDDVITLYNAIVRVRLEPSKMGSTARITIDNKLSNIQTLVVNIYERLEQIIVLYVKQFNAMPNLTTATPNKATNALMNLSRPVSKLITAFAVYRIIKQQIDSSNFDVIDLSTFNHVVKQLVDRNPDLRVFTAKLSSNVDLPRLHENVIRDMLYKQAREKKGAPLTNAEKTNIRENVLPKFYSDKIAMKNAYEAELGRPLSREEQDHLIKFVFPTTEGSSVVIEPPPALTGEPPEADPVVEPVVEPTTDALSEDEFGNAITAHSLECRRQFETRLREQGFEQGVIIQAINRINNQIRRELQTAGILNAEAGLRSGLMDADLETAKAIIDNVFETEEKKMTSKPPETEVERPSSGDDEDPDEPGEGGDGSKTKAKAKPKAKAKAQSKAEASSSS